MRQSKAVYNKLGSRLAKKGSEMSSHGSSTNMAPSPLPNLSYVRMPKQVTDGWKAGEKSDVGHL